jgi:hypothetical protein
MQEAGEGLATAAGLAGDQHPGVVLGDALDLLAQPLHGRRAAGGFVHQRRAPTQADVLALELVRLQRALDGQQQLGHGQRLFQEVVGAEAGRLDRGLDVAVAGHHDHRAGQALVLVPLLEQADAVEIGHPDVEQHQVRAALAQRVSRRLAVLGAADGVALVLEDVLHRLSDVGLVVHDEDVGRAHGSPACRSALWCGRRSVRARPAAWP